MPEIDETEMLGDDADLHALRAFIQRVEPIDPMWQTPPAGSWERIAEEAGLAAAMEATPAPVPGAERGPTDDAGTGLPAPLPDRVPPPVPPSATGRQPGRDTVSPALVLVVGAVVLLLVALIVISG